MSYGFYGGTPPHQARDTSHAAAEAARENAGTQRAAVYRMIYAAGEGGCTQDEVEAALHMLHQTASPRRCELEQAGHIADSGKRRPTRSKRAAIVWVISALAPKQDPRAPKPDKREILEAVRALGEIYRATGGVGFVPALIKTVTWLADVERWRR